MMDLEKEFPFNYRDVGCPAVSLLGVFFLSYGWSTYPPGPRTPSPRNKGLIRPY